MTTPIKTQCPYCQAYSNIQKTQLNQADAKILCDHCQQGFLVNKYLIVNTNKVSTNADSANPLTKPTNSSNLSDLPSHNLVNPAIDNAKHIDATASTKMSANKKKPEAKAASDTLIYDDMDTSETLIHDDMDGEETPEISLEYDSLDGMDAWLDQANTTNDSFPSSSEPQKNSARTPNKSANVNVNPSPISPSNNNTDHKTAVETAMSSTTANDIHASVGSTSDNQWLEQLLEEQNENKNAAEADTDLAQLLINMGVPIKDEDEVDQVRASKNQVRKQSTKTPARTSIAVILWTMGSLVLVMLLFAQYVIFNLNTLIKNPAYAEHLQTVCSIASCSLPNADLTALAVTDLNHRTSQVNTTSGYSDLQASLSNQSSQTQLLPSLKVSVYSLNGLIGEFIAMPSDYLLSTQSQLAAKGRKQVMFTIPVANNQISKITINPIY